MGPEFLITIDWCTILDGIRKEDIQKEQKYSFGEWKNRYNSCERDLVTNNRRLAYCIVLFYNRKQYNLTMADRGRNM